MNVGTAVSGGGPGPVGWEALRAKRRSRGAIVYLTTKAGSSYGWDTPINESLGLLYKHYNNKYKNDILIFHNGDYGPEDELAQRRLGRKEVHFIKLDAGHKHWMMPHAHSVLPFRSWMLPKFSVGYRHMCRWYSHLFADFLLEMGYEYAARFDDDSLMLSPPAYDFFEHMESTGAEYAFRADAFEGCCHPEFRHKLLGSFLNYSGTKPTFLYEATNARKGGADKYNSYGYYNNFFVVKLELYRRPAVRTFLGNLQGSCRTVVETSYCAVYFSRIVCSTQESGWITWTGPTPSTYTARTTWPCSRSWCRCS